MDTAVLQEFFSYRFTKFSQSLAESDAHYELWEETGAEPTDGERRLRVIENLLNDFGDAFICSIEGHNMLDHGGDVSSGEINIGCERCGYTFHAWW